MDGKAIRQGDQAVFGGIAFQQEIVRSSVGDGIFLAVYQTRVAVRSDRDLLSV